MKKINLLLAVFGLAMLAACQSPSYYNSGRSNTNSEFNCMAGTVGGALIGGLLGSTIGKGGGRTAATAVGIGAGGYVGNRMGCQ